MARVAALPNPAIIAAFINLRLSMVETHFGSGGISRRTLKVRQSKGSYERKEAVVEEWGKRGWGWGDGVVG